MPNKLSDLRTDVAEALITCAKEAMDAYASGETLSERDMAYCWACRTFFSEHSDLLMLAVRAGVAYGMTPILLFGPDPAAAPANPVGFIPANKVAQP